MTASNGTAAPTRLWPNGPSVPLTTPFVSGGEEVDHVALAKHVVRVAKAGLGIVLLGTTGEASHMSPAERKAAAATARKALDDAGLVDVPLCVGTGGGSLKTTVELCHDAAEAGASHCIVICPGYFAFAMGRDKTAILGFFKGVFDRSPLPVMIYNFPGAAAGIDLNSDDISELAEHPNCFGVKLTCGAVGKGQRIAAYTQSAEYLARRGNSLKASTVTGQFQVLPGFSESLLPVLLGRHTGCITGTGGVIPKTVRKLYDSALKGLQGDVKALAEAQDLQEKVAAADWIMVKVGVQGTKYALDSYIEPGGEDGDSIDVTDAGVTYTTSVGVGSPATQYTLLIDTGSSNTWVGAGKSYVKTSTSKSTGQKVNVSYGSGSFSGTEYTDTVTLGSDLVIKNQSIGVASTAQGFSDVDGILGIGPVDLTSGTVANNQPVPTVTDNLFSQGTISVESIGISYEPTTTSSEGTMNGELTFGGVDTSKTTGDVNYVPITSTSPASNYWGIDQSISYDNNTILDSTAGIVDTGTTLIMIATDAFQAYEKATGATMDQTTGLLSITEAQFENLQSLFFNIGGVQYELTANAQIWPRALNSTLGGDSSKIYLVVADMGSQSGQGLDFINGFTFLQRFYSVYDTTNSQLGLATTSFTDATTN